MNHTRRHMATPPQVPGSRPYITVVQYNCLADGLSGGDAGFDSLPPDEMAWPKRGFELTRKIIDADADVVCLQEVDHYHDTFRPALHAQGYDGVYREDEWSPCIKTTDGKLADGVAIFYKREKLELLGMHVPFTPRDVKVPPIEERRDAGKCLVARLRMRAPIEQRRGPGWRYYTCAKLDFIVATLHLASEKNEEGVKRREAQALCAMKEILTFKAMSGAGREDRLSPIVVAGDLNAQPHEPAVEVFKKLGLMSCYARHIRAEPLFTTWKIRTGPYKPGEAKMTIDYIFAQHSAFDVYDVLAMPRSDEIGPKGLPCRGHPSDHLMLKASLEFIVEP